MRLRNVLPMLGFTFLMEVGLYHIIFLPLHFLVGLVLLVAVGIAFDAGSHCHEELFGSLVQLS